MQCLSGTGEQLIQSDFARSLYHVLGCAESGGGDRSECISAFLGDFVAHDYGRESSAGFILVTGDAGAAGEFWYGFTTSSMGLGFMSGRDDAPISLVDRRPAGAKFRLSGRSF